MPDNISKSDIYGRNGVLLLAKGQKITESVAKKLKILNGVRKSEPRQFTEDSKITLCTDHIKTEVFNLNDPVFEDASGTLKKIIFDSKGTTWWMPVNTLSNYVDWLYTHSIDVALLSLVIASKAGYGGSEKENLCLGALLHDIGKLLVPKDIIQKPGKLNAQEMTLMRQHCDLGYSMAKEFQMPENCTGVILQHHERIDGSGYPKGIKGDMISPDAKIVMIADALDAMTSYRPYKSVKTLKSAVNELKQCGSEYDKSYVDILSEYLN